MPVNKTFQVQDQWGTFWRVVLPHTMGYKDETLIRLEGRGSYDIEEGAFKVLATMVLRSYGYVVIHPDSVVLLNPPPKEVPPA